MQAKSYEYWESIWNDIRGTDVEKTLAILAAYVDESKQGWFPLISNAISSLLGLLPDVGLLPTVGVSVNFARAREVEKSLEGLGASTSTVESVLANLKRNIKDYRGYQLESFFSSRMMGTDTFDARPDYFYVKNMEVRDNTLFLDYAVIALNGKVVTDALELPLTKLNCLDDNWILGCKDITPCFSDILDLTSAAGITRGPGIHRQLDNLAVIFEVIKRRTASAVDYFSLNETVMLETYRRLGYPTALSDVTDWQKQALIEGRPRTPYLTCFLRYINADDFNSRIKDIALLEDDRSRLSIQITLSSEDAYDHFITELMANGLPLPVEKIIHRQWHRDFYDENTRFPPNVILIHKGSLYYSNEEGKAQEMGHYYSSHEIAELVGIGLHQEYDVAIPMNQWIRSIYSHPPALGNRFERQYSLCLTDFSYPNQQLLSKFLTTLIEIEPSTSAVVDDLAQTLSFYWLKVDALDLEYALRQAIRSQARGEYEAIWTLAQDYYATSFLSDKPKKSVHLHDLRRIFGAITKDNPHYAAAQTELSHLTFSDEDNLKDAFCYALRGRDPVYTANLYRDLCGLALFQSPIKSVQLDAETLLNIAEHIKTQNFFKPVTQEQSTQTDDASFVHDAIGFPGRYSAQP